MSNPQRIVLCAVLGVICAAAPRIHHEFGQHDTDIYARTARAMKAGEGYYRAADEANPVKPSALRSVRPPTTSLLLRVVPARAWVVAEAAAWAVALWFTMQMGGLLAGIVAALWLIVASRYGFALYAEIFGLPFAMWGLVEVKRGNDRRAALAFSIATIFRELYAVGLLLGLLRSFRRSGRARMPARRRPWLVATAGIGVLYLLHAHAAHPLLTGGGHEEAFGSSGYHFWNVTGVLSWNVTRLLSPAGIALGLGIAVLVYVVAQRNLVRARDWFTLGYIVALALLTAWSLRYYWEITYVPALVAVAFARVKKAKIAPVLTRIHVDLPDRGPAIAFPK